MAAASTVIVAAVRLEIRNTSNGALPPSSNQNPLERRRPFLSFTKPSWIVKSESNVYRETIKKPDPPCVVCRGSGRVHCNGCRGKGRTNEVHLVMLPKGVWPKWCQRCSGSGLGYCSRCFGTGEYRSNLLGFNFVKSEKNDEHNSLPSDPGSSGIEDLFSYRGQSD